MEVCYVGFPNNRIATTSPAGRLGLFPHPSPPQGRLSVHTGVCRSGPGVVELVDRVG